jgi:hypothetical protein
MLCPNNILDYKKSRYKIADAVLLQRHWLYVLVKTFTRSSLSITTYN